MPSLTIQNYVKEIYQIAMQGPEKAASTGEIAAALKVSPGTVTSMLKTLSETGLASYTKYEGVRLTESGRKLALRVLRRHRLIELFLVHTLDLAWDEVHEEAENMEHAVSDFLVDRIDQFLGYPSSDPHGDPIPTADGKIRTEEGVKLTQWEPGKPFRLIRVMDQSPDFLRYLSEETLQPGCEAKLIANRPEAGILMIEIKERVTALGIEAADKLMVTSIT
ncbi:metal-dependent transcriptional regulator [Bremerella cremea]|uniref:Transcriptional regulator MntR n=1 Tax=Blastopirellula marina TaxID=124 RepID=A0A2S8F8W6_9BACT|nr:MULTISPECIES: metal-dependent transcriptional regulator [Pirellulaceae]PQO28599.1 metal-dependent transcriptional regulator [Blastopirellula marina]RCS41970.1 metal-dependent transcriptional regulator [Bremerella cremea]